MGTAQQQRIHVGIPERLEQPLGEHVHLIRSGVSAFDELDEARAGCTGQPDPGPLSGHRPLVGP